MIDIDAAVDVMVEGTLRIATEQPLRVGVGHAVNPDVAALLIERLTAEPGIVDVTTYEVGPSVGAHTGAGTFGVVYAPVGRSWVRHGASLAGPFVNVVHPHRAVQTEGEMS